MPKKSYVWNGPPTTVDIFDEANGVATLAYEGQVATGRPLPVMLDTESPQTKSWLAFNLITETPAPEPVPEAAPVAAEEPTPVNKRTRSKENADG